MYVDTDGPDTEGSCYVRPICDIDICTGHYNVMLLSPVYSNYIDVETIK